MKTFPSFLNDFLLSFWASCDRYQIDPAGACSLAILILTLATALCEVFSMLQCGLRTDSCHLGTNKDEDLSFLPQRFLAVFLGLLRSLSNRSSGRPHDPDTGYRAVRGVQYAAVRFANRFLPFGDVVARWIAIKSIQRATTSPNGRNRFANRTAAY
jgi:hypothetical protein